jgi:tetratricopeptide (TPR) repeat protein
VEAAGLDAGVERFRAGRAAGETSPEAARAAAELDALWGREAEKLLERAAREQTERLAFIPEERLLLDLGLLDWRLVPGGDGSRPALLRELYAPGPPGHLYFSEWLAQRYRQFLLTGGMAAPAEPPPPPSKPVEEASRLLPVLPILRAKLYAKLAPFFQKLPGFNDQAVRTFLEGRIDTTLDAAALPRTGEEESPAALRLRQLAEMRGRMIARARERARSEADLSLFDALRKLDRQAERERSPASAPAAPAAPRAPQAPEREEFLRGELRLVRSLLPIGAAGSGLSKSTAVALSLGSRVQKGDLDPVLALVRVCDPLLPPVRTVLIAPYAGGGFYEWDRDTVFVPLIPLRPVEEAIVGALAHYRIMLDTLQEGGRLRREYEMAFGGDDFRAAFARDYQAWVLGAGKGSREAVDPRRFTFFRDYIGPQAATLFAPREWQALTPVEREETLRLCRERVARGEAAFEDHYRLAVDAARTDQHADSIRELQKALQLCPVDGRALLALGHLAVRLGGTDTARRVLQECLAMAPDSLWAVYASVELEKL